MAIPFQNYNFIGDTFATGGLNLKAALTNFKDNESPSCQNVIFTKTGSVAKRNGFFKLNSTQLPGTTTGIFQLNKSDGTSGVIIGNNTDLYLSATSPVSFKSGQTAGALYSFAALNDYAFIVNGVDGNLKYDLLTVSGLGISAPGAAPTDGGALAGANLTAASNYQWVFTFVNADGHESNPSPVSAIIVTGGAGNQDRRINITASADIQVVARNVYRTFANLPGAYFFAGSVNDNVTLIFDDHTPDASLGAQALFDNDKPPVLKYIVTHKNRLFGVEAANPSRLRFSKDLNQDAWPALFFDDVSPDDGENITALVSFFDQLIIFKRTSIYILSGNNETDFIVQRSQGDSRIGCVSNRTAWVCDNFVLFLSERGIYGFDGLRTQYLSANMEPIFDVTNSNQSLRYNFSQEGITCAANYKNGSRNWYVLSLPSGSSTSNTFCLVYDFTLGNWTIFQGIFAHSLAIVQESNEPKLYSGDYNGFLWKQDTTNNDGFFHFPSFSTSNTNTNLTLRDDSQANVVSVATSGGAATLTDTTLLGVTLNQYAGKQIYIESGTGIGQVNTIVSNTVTPVTFTVMNPWGVIPDNTSHYIVGGWQIDAAKGVRVKILSGKDIGDIRLITSNLPTKFTISVPWSTNPDTTSEYSIGFIEAEWQSRWFHYNIPEFVKRLRYIHINTEREGNYNLDIGFRFDFEIGDQNTFFQSLSLAGTNSIWDQSMWDMASWDQTSLSINRISNTSNTIHRYVQILFRNNAGGEPFAVNSLNMLYQVKGVRR